jgi:hypothetical protein
VPGDDGQRREKREQIGHPAHWLGRLETREQGTRQSLLLERR